MTHNFMRMAHSRKLELNKVVSYGNQIDLKVEDYLEYLAEDDTVKVIAAYIEDIKNPRRFMDALNKTTRKKPVVILKGGITEQGAKAAASHTGAMAASHEIWTAVMKQSNGIAAAEFRTAGRPYHDGHFRENPCRTQAWFPWCRGWHLSALHRFLIAGRPPAARTVARSPEAASANASAM